MDKLLDDSEFYGGRFSCDCLHPAHTVDISVEFYNKQPQSVTVDFAETYMGNQLTLWERIKCALAVLQGKEIWGHGFLIRQEDIPAMRELLQKALLRTYTDGN